MCKAAYKDDRWLIILAIVLAAVVFVFPSTVSFPLLDPDEGLHATIAQEMVEGGDWLTPRFLGEAFFDKPILFFWCQALSLRLFGMNEAALRLPGLMFGLLGAATTVLVGRRLFGSTAGWVAGIFYCTMILPVALAQAAAHDVVLIPCVNLAILFFWQGERSRSKSAAAGYLAATGLVLGLAILAKGLVGVAMVAIAYGSYAIITRRSSMAILLGGLAAFLLAGLVAAPWYMAMDFKHPGFLNYYFIQRHILGFATPTQVHGNAPWWYYLPIVLGGGLPWIAYVPDAVRDAFARRIQNNAAGENAVASEGNPIVLLLCWLIGGAILFSVAHSKLITYIWPVFPAVAVLAAVGWARLLDGTLVEPARRSLLRSFFISSITGPIVLPLVVFVVHKIFAVSFPPMVWVAACSIGFVALIPLVFLKKQQWRAMLAASIMSTTLQFVAALTLVVPIVAENFTARGLADHFNHIGRLPQRLLVAEERIGSLIFYLNPDLRAGLRKNQISTISYKQPIRAPAGAIIVLPEARAYRAYKYAEISGLPYKTVGRYRLYESIDRSAADK